MNKKIEPAIVGEEFAIRGSKMRVSRIGAQFITLDCCPGSRIAFGMKPVKTVAAFGPFKKTVVKQHPRSKSASKFEVGEKMRLNNGSFTVFSFSRKTLMLEIALGL
jgi:hypothetical protein